MSFAKDIKATPLLEDALHAGLGALRAVDKAHVKKGGATRLLGSVDIDSALHDAEPNAARWDYLIGEQLGKQERLHWVEVHPASGTGNIGEIERKLAWLTNWMRSTTLVTYPKRIVWVASGKSSFNSRHPALKTLASRGLVYAGGQLTI